MASSKSKRGYMIYVLRSISTPLHPHSFFQVVDRTLSAVQHTHTQTRTRAHTQTYGYRRSYLKVSSYTCISSRGQGCCLPSSLFGYDSNTSVVCRDLKERSSITMKSSHPQLSTLINCCNLFSNYIYM